MNFEILMFIMILFVMCIGIRIQSSHIKDLIKRLDVYTNNQEIGEINVALIKNNDINARVKSIEETISGKLSNVEMVTKANTVMFNEVVNDDENLIKVKFPLLVTSKGRWIVRGCGQDNFDDLLENLNDCFPPTDYVDSTTYWLTVYIPSRLKQNIVFNNPTKELI